VASVAAAVLSLLLFGRISENLIHAETNRAEYRRHITEELKTELDNVINRIQYLREEKKAEINSVLKSRTETAGLFVRRLMTVNGKENGMKTAVDILRVNNSGDRLIKLYIFSFDGTAVLFPPAPAAEGTSIYGYRTFDGDMIFSRILNDLKKHSEAYASYRLQPENGEIIPAKKVIRCVGDRDSGIAVCAEADYEAAEKIMKDAVLDDITKYYMLQPAYSRINIFETEESFSGETLLKTVLNEELENNEEINEEKSQELTPMVLSGKKKRTSSTQRPRVRQKHHGNNCLCAISGVELVHH
jgi:hypothetical protein